MLTAMATKRIQSVTIRRILDCDPDTSHLGKYTDTIGREYTIDRVHSLSCPVNNPQNTAASDQIDRISNYLDAVRVDTLDTEALEALSDAQSILMGASDAANSCDCNESGDAGRNEYRYFNTSGNYKGGPIADIVQYTKQDYARMESYNNQNWSYIGIRATCELTVDGVTQTIRSAGLWGIESDSDDSYLESVESEELAELRKIVHGLGFSKRAIATAFKNIEHRDGE